LWVVLTALVCAWQGPGFLDNFRPSRHALVDFLQEWGSARFYFDGLPVYGPQEEVVRRYLGEDRDRRQHFNEVNAHPPTAILLSLPLARLDYSDACLVWNLLSMTALAATLGILVRELRLRFSVWDLLPFVTLLVLCYPLQQQIYHGQLNLILLLLLTGAWAADRNGRPVPAGVLLGTATAIKLIPGLLFVYFLLRRQWRVVAAGVLTVALWTALTAVVFGPGAYRDYVGDVLPQLPIRYRNLWINCSLPAFWYKVFDGSGTGGHTISLWHSPLVARVGTALSCLLVLGGLAAAVPGARSRAQQDQAFGACVTAMLLVSPITWAHYFVLLLLPATLLWLRLSPARGRRLAFWVCVALIWLKVEGVFWAVAVPFPAAQWAQYVATPWQTLTGFSLRTYALLGLFVLGLLASREPKPAAPAQAGP
jgi:hypothetical protein